MGVETVWRPSKLVLGVQPGRLPAKISAGQRELLDFSDVVIGWCGLYLGYFLPTRAV